MAETFDAQVQPEQPDNWLFYSREARETPQGNRGNLLMSDAVGKSLEGGLKVGDDLMGSYVQDKVQEVELRNRQNFITAAQNTLDGTQQQSSGILDNQDSLANAPTGVKQAVNRVQTLKAAYDGGKVDKYGYYAKVIPELQAVRDEFPGHRHIVDAALNNQANQMMNTLVNELNRRDAEGREDRRRLTSEVWAMRSEIPHAEQLLQGIQNGMPTAQVYQALAPSFKHVYDMRMREEQFKTDEWQHQRDAWSQKDKQNQVEQTITSDVGHIFTSGAYFPMITHAGPANWTPQEQIDEIQRQRMSGNYDAEKSTLAATRLGAYRDYNIQLATASAARIMQQAGVTIPPERINQIIREQSSWLNNFTNAVGDDKTLALAMANKLHVEQIRNKDVESGFTDPVWGTTNRALAQGIAIAGAQNASSIWESFVGRPAMQGWAGAITSGQMLPHLFQPDKDKGQLQTAGQSAAYMKAQGATAANFKDYSDMIDGFTNKDVDMPTKWNIAKGFFAPTEENRKYIGMFNKDYWDPTQQRWINGADTLFGKLTSPFVTDQVVKMHDGQLSKDYRTTVDAWFKTLFSKDMATMHDAEQAAVTRGSTSPSRAGQQKEIAPKIKIGWDNTNHRLYIDPKAEEFLRSTGQRAVLDSRDRMNGALANISHIFDKLKEFGDKTDINSYLLQELRTQMGFDPTYKDTLAKVHDAIVASHQQPETEEKTTKKAEE